MDIPTGVTQIGKEAFCRCNMLESVSFAKEAKLKKIESGAFKGCGKLKEVYLPKNTKDVADDAFSSSTKVIKL